MEKIILRRPQLRKDDFYKHGFGEGCRGCRATIMREKSARDPSEACRSRMEQELETTESGKMKLQRTRERMRTQDTRGKRVGREEGQKEDV